MYQTSIQQQTENFDKNDLNLLKNTILVFVISKLGSFGANYIGQLLLGVLINYGGILVLCFGLYTFSTKYSKLENGIKVVGLFVIGIIIDFISNIYLILNPISFSDSNTQTVQQFIEQLKPLVQLVNVAVIFGVFGGILTLIIYYYFTEWINDGFSKPFDRIKVFFYAGIIICVGQILFVVSLLMYNSVFTSFINSGIVTQSDIDTLDQARSVMTLGSLLLLVGFITEIIGGFKIYNRINDHFTGKYFYELYNQPYPGFPNQRPPYQSPNSYNPYQNYPNQPYQNQPHPNQPYPNQPYPNQPYFNQPYQKPQNQSQNNQNYQNSEGVSANDNQNSPTDMNFDKKIICNKCHTELQMGTRFCFRCGTKVT